jgi:hypothetical protein
MVIRLLVIILELLVVTIMHLMMVRMDGEQTKDLHVA